MLYIALIHNLIQYHLSARQKQEGDIFGFQKVKIYPLEKLTLF